jgi:hypothetical protein
MKAPLARNIDCAYLGPLGSATKMGLICFVVLLPKEPIHNSLSLLQNLHLLLYPMKAPLGRKIDCAYLGPLGSATKIGLICFWCLAAQGTDAQEPFTFIPFTALAYVVASNESTSDKKK